MAENRFAAWATANQPDDEPPAEPENRFAQWATDPDPLETDEPEDGMTKVAPGVFARALDVAGKAIEQTVGGVEMAATIGSSMVAEPVSGLVGIAGAIAPGEPGQGARAAEATREAMTYTPETETGQAIAEDVASYLAPVGEGITAVEETLGEATLEATGSELLATAAHTVPTALMEFLGMGILRKGSKAAKAATEAQKRYKKTPDMTDEDVALEMIDPEDRSYQQITETLKRKQNKELAKDVRPDLTKIRDAEALGIDLNPSAYSTSEAFIRVEQAVKSQPGFSRLAAREAEAIQKLGERADEMITEFGGVTNKSLLDADVSARMNATIKDLGEQAEKVYRRVNENIPAATKVTGRASRAYLTARLEELGGDKSLLSAAERKLHKIFGKDQAPTYEALDTIRRQVGQAYQRAGVFKDDLSGNLDQVYKALITDQSGVAKVLGVGQEFDAARKLVQTRKDLEGRATYLFGNDIAKSMLPKLTQSATALTKGDVLQFRKLMQALPSDMRTAAAATMLNDLFTLGARSKGSIGGGFASAYEKLNRNAGAKAELFKYLPTAARKRFDALGNVSTGIYRAMSLQNNSRTARDILQALESASLPDKLYGPLRPVAYMFGGPASGLAADAVGKAVKNQAKRATAADELMSSAAFMRAVNVAMEGRVREANIMMRRSATWRKFRGTVGEGTKRQLAAIGPIAWLTSQPEIEQPVVE